MKNSAPETAVRGWRLDASFIDVSRTLAFIGHRMYYYMSGLYSLLGSCTSCPARGGGRGRLLKRVREREREVRDCSKHLCPITPLLSFSRHS